MALGLVIAERSKLDGSELYDNAVDGGEVDGDEFEDNEVGEKVQKRSKSKNLSKSTLDFLISGAKLAFTELRQAFLKALIFQHFDREHYIRIETDSSGYAICGILSQLTSDNLGQWHPVAFFFQKMIPAETKYKTHDSKLLAIVEAFKIWRHYLEGSYYEILVFTDHNNLQQFMDTKSSSYRQVRWAQKLSCYHFRIDYCQSKANGAADALFQYSQRNVKEKDALQAKNVKILYHLQSLLTNASLSGLTLFELSPLHQVLVCETHILLKLRQFWNSL